MKYLSFLLLLVSQVVHAQSETHQIFDAKGKKTSYKKMMKTLQKADVILFGELHNNAIAHYFQVKTAKSLAQHPSKQLIIGAEMFERDQADLLQSYMDGTTDKKTFEQEMRLWHNYKTDYKPLLHFAKENNINYIATNIPRRYASMLYRHGVSSLDTLSMDEKSWIAPLPFPYDKNLPAYVKMMDMFKDSNHSNENFPKSQAIKDATMGYFITQNWEPNTLFLHLNGSYHSDFHEAIGWYIRQYNQNLSVKTISVVEQEDLNSLEEEHHHKADFIIVADSDMPKSYE